jgi:hypothetical protein
VPAHDGDVPGANALLKSTLLTVKFGVFFIHLNCNVCGWKSKSTYFYLQACNQSAQILQKSRNHLKILGARTVTCSKFRPKGPQILGATIQNLVAMPTERTDLGTPTSYHFARFPGSPNSCDL